MNKKKLPKAIRLNVTHTSSPKSRPKTSEPMPEARVLRTLGQTRQLRQARSLKLPLTNAEHGRVTWLSVSPYGPGSPDFFRCRSSTGCGWRTSIQMLRRISQIYDFRFPRIRGKALIAGFAGTMISASTGLGMASMIKSVPVAGTAIGAITTPALSMGATYVIGMAFIEHFASGGTLLDFDPPDYREFIKADMAARKA